MIDRKIVESVVHDALAKQNCSDVNKLTNQQMIDLFTDVIAHTAKATEEIGKELERDAKSSMRTRG